MTAMLSKMSILCVKAGYEMRLASYASKHALQCLTVKVFVRTYTHAYRTTVLISETFTVWFRAVLEVRLDSYGLRQ